MKIEELKPHQTVDFEKFRAWLTEQVARSGFKNIREDLDVYQTPQPGTTEIQFYMRP